MERTLLLLVSLYALAVTIRHVLHQPAVSKICQRDFADTAAIGSCLCGKGEYCLCTPSLAVDAIVELVPATGVRDENTRVAFILRGDGRGLALIGGFLQVGEQAEDGVRREVFEETGLRLAHLEQFCLFSAPARDPRRHTAALIFVARSLGEPQAGDDAKAIRTYTINELHRNPPTFAFDHGRIVSAYLERFSPLGDRRQRAGQLAACPGTSIIGRD
jgi:ADP-ribose pyrophosphatase YjhB (NUDIX family)